MQHFGSFQILCCYSTMIMSEVQLDLLPILERDPFPDITFLNLTSDVWSQTHMHTEMHYAMG